MFLGYIYSDGTINSHLPFHHVYGYGRWEFIYFSILLELSYTITWEGINVYILVLLVFAEHYPLYQFPQSHDSGQNIIFLWIPYPTLHMQQFQLILDIFSRNIVGWEVWSEETAENASHLIRRTVMAQKVTHREGPLVLHSDNVSPMKGSSMLETLYQLGITPSRSRPRVSNDNPYSEAIFRTCKYCPSYPTGGFATLDNARSWVKNLFTGITIIIATAESNFLHRINVIVVKGRRFWKNVISYIRLQRRSIQNAGHAKLGTGRYPMKYGLIQKKLRLMIVKKRK